MKYRGYLLVALSLFFASCKDNTKFSVDGKFENFGSESKVYLYGMKGNDMTVIDSTVLNDKGEFKFERPSEMADFYRISIAQNDYMFTAKNGDEIIFNADFANPDHTYKLRGADEADKMMAFNTLKFKGSQSLNRIKDDFDKKVDAQPDKRDELLASIKPMYDKEVQKLNADIIQFANENANSLVGFYAISSINPQSNEKALFDWANKASEEIKKNPAVKSFVDLVASMKSVQTGQQAPEFTIPALNGGTLSLSQYKGKYVLLDFWASWCGPCRAENPNVVKAYNQFKNRNFTVLGISLDKDKQAWVQAIKQDGLTWDHASELADFEGKTVRLYQVQAIPASFLIDPQGKIIARDLRGAELESFLNKTLP